jgi:predicted alpha-1,2-mannosidase
MTHARRPRGRRWRTLAATLITSALTAGLLGTIGTGTALAADEDYAQYVNPLIGTDNSPFILPEDAPTGGAGGSAFPGATVPFGRVQWSPDTHQEGSSYKYAATEIDGFSINHTSGAGCKSLQTVPFFATVGSGQAGGKIGFSHNDETASPGYYKVKLANQAWVELTATQRTGFARFTFPTTEYANVIVDANKNSFARSVSVGSDNKTITGWVESSKFCGKDHPYKIYFTTVFERPFVVTSNLDGTLRLTFDARTDKVVQAKVGTSMVSAANAAANITSENNAWNFGAVREAARAAWNTRLNSIKISGGTTDQLRIFYTALYLSMLHPNVATDSNGQYRGLDGQVKTATGYTQYVNFSGWDVYRTQAQLLAMIAPTVASDWARSLLTHAQECGGAMPKWTLYNSESNVMVGTPAIPAISSIAAFGANTFVSQDPNALAKMIYSASTAVQKCGNYTVADGLAGYMSRGWVSTQDTVADFGGPGSAAWTQEYAIADFALAQFAKERGDTATYTKYLERSKNWRNVFERTGKHIRPRMTSGEFVWGQDNTPIVEGTAAQYTWMNPHDVSTVVDLVGGKSAAVTKLDTLFTRLNAGEGDPYFYIGNQPGYWAPWAYLWAGNPSRTQNIVERIRTESFTSGPGGYPGNLDLGATSSWLVLASLGIFPAIPGTDLLTLNGPTFPSTTLTLANNKTLTITASNVSSTNRYIQGLTVNGVASSKAWTRFSSIKDGATLAFTMGGTASSWGSAAADAPPSFFTTPPQTGEDFARTATPSSDVSSCASDEGPAQAIDESASTKWCAFSNNLQGSLTLDLGQPREIKRWVVDHAGAGGENTAWNTKDFKLQSRTSTTDSWTDRDPVTGNTANTTDRTITATTARYWRIQITNPTSTSANTAIRLYGVKLYGGTTTAPTDLALNKAATSNNSCNGTLENATMGVDGKADTKWCGFVSNGEAWLQVNLGTAASVKRWVVKHAESGGEVASRNTKAYALQYSSGPNGTWTEFDGVTGNIAASTDRTVNTAVTAQYWRLKVTVPTQTTDGAARIYALELYS